MKTNNKSIFILGITALLSFYSCSTPNNSMENVVSRGLERAKIQCVAMAEILSSKDSLLPRTSDSYGNLVTSDSRWWTSGFFPGTLWYLYEYTLDERIRKYAEEYTLRVEREKYTTNNHDVGFMLYCSFGNGLRLMDYSDYAKVLVQGAESLSTRFNENVGLIRSWDDHEDKWEYPVIIDNMMNLELMMWASKYTGDDRFRNIAISHADNTMRNHYRSDFSCFHVVGYDKETGAILSKNTQQGYSDDSSWARGQAWGLYGFTMMYRETENLQYLLFAENIAKYLLHHPKLPKDKIPYWDYDDPKIPDSLRDASAAAIMASALIELSQYTTDEQLSKECIGTAETILRTLTSEEYLAEPGTNANFVLKHSVGNMPANSEVDVPLTYADYYYIEALMRYRHLFL